MRRPILPLLVLAGLLLLGAHARAAVGDGLHPPEPVRLMIFGPGSDDATRIEAELLCRRFPLYVNRWSDQD